ncbi:hypothetical protein DFJ73DRAFT_943401, partial [Zopfochytrium polystomum]
RHEKNKEKENKTANVWGKGLDWWLRRLCLRSPRAAAGVLFTLSGGLVEANWSPASSVLSSVRRESKAPPTPAYQSQADLPKCNAIGFLLQLEGRRRERIKIRDQKRRATNTPTHMPMPWLTRSDWATAEAAAGPSGASAAASHGLAPALERLGAAVDLGSWWATLASAFPIATARKCKAGQALAAPPTSPPPPPPPQQQQQQQPRSTAEDELPALEQRQRGVTAGSSPPPSSPPSSSSRMRIATTQDHVAAAALHHSPHRGTTTPTTGTPATATPLPGSPLEQRLAALEAHLDATATVLAAERAARQALAASADALERRVALLEGFARHTTSQLVHLSGFLDRATREARTAVELSGAVEERLRAIVEEAGVMSKPGAVMVAAAAAAMEAEDDEDEVEGVVRDRLDSPCSRSSTATLF